MTVNTGQHDETEVRQHEEREQEHEYNQKDKHIITSPQFSSSSVSPLSNHLSISSSPPPDSPLHSTFKWIETKSPNPPSPLVHANRSFPPEPLTKVQDPQTQEGFAAHQHKLDEEEAASGSGTGGVGSFNRPKLRPDLSGFKRTKKESEVKKVLLGFRICILVCCLISFSVMAADKYQGWALDSFYRYKEFRYCLSVNVLGFAYSGLQVLDLVHFFTTRTHLVHHHLRYHFDFLIDQILSYLLISASSSAATRVDDWQSNWGKDKFPDMARASVGLSFAAFVALACSSIISGYFLFTPESL
ncbi:hypothetical protein FNV43_RR14358 [Rhamnella rubrinervis]|uniref:CASP-like protein n=1 Tax=Rhamnella rubrinervis TaxID=2594499 RepID=A0A8K0MGA0_9ROSA|nr:hypothetical protein FNV43_RR14358 [Rhamnella rubrinervis]